MRLRCKDQADRFFQLGHRLWHGNLKRSCITSGLPKRVLHARGHRCIWNRRVMSPLCRKLQSMCQLSKWGVLEFSEGPLSQVLCCSNQGVNQTYCTECRNSTYLTPFGWCAADCPDGSYEHGNSTVGRTCPLCPSSCNTCEPRAWTDSADLCSYFSSFSFLPCLGLSFKLVQACAWTCSCKQLKYTTVGVRCFIFQVRNALHRVQAVHVPDNFAHM